MNSKDIIISLALEYDLPTLLNYCRTSKRINDLVCNNNLFWILKLKKDFDITFENRAIKNMNPKDYYADIVNEMRRFSSMNKLYSHAIHIGWQDLVKIALDRGADIKYVDEDITPLIRAIILNQPHIADYLLERGIIVTEDDFVYNISTITRFINERGILKIQKEDLFRFMYDKIFPRMYHLLKLSKYPSFLKTVINKLEEYKVILPDLYERRINELKELMN